MPVLHNAKKKLKQDKKHNLHNKKIRETLKSAVKSAKTGKTPELISEAFSGIDKAAKQHIIHKNKAARMKSSLSKISSTLAK